MPDNSTLPNHKLLFETDIVSVYHNIKDNWIYAKWSGRVTLEKHINGYEQMLPYFKKKHCHKYLEDNTNISGIFIEVTEWIVNDFAPRAIEAGLEDIALVYSRDQYSRLSDDSIISKLPLQIICIAFNNIDIAQEWLRSMKSKKK